MNIRKIGFIATLATVLVGCEHATEKYVIKDGKKLLTKETIELFAKKYSPIDTIKTSTPMTKTQEELIVETRDLFQSTVNDSSVKTGVNAEGKAFIVYTNYGARSAMQLDKSGTLEKSTTFENGMRPGRNTTVNYYDHERSDNKVIFENNKLKEIDVNINRFNEKGEYTGKVFD